MQTPGRYALVVLLVALGAHGAGADLLAHAGPPFPIVSRRVVGPYEISVWTDPDATDDGSAEGQFWVVVEPAQPGGMIPRGTGATVSIRPLDREGPERSGAAHGEDGSPYFVALLMDHEGRFAVRAVVDGPLGAAEVEAEVDATYDLRPPPVMLVVYAVPFLFVGFLWVKVLRARRRAPAASGRERHAAKKGRDIDGQDRSTP